MYKLPLRVICEMLLQTSKIFQEEKIKHTRKTKIIVYPLKKTSPKTGRTETILRNIPNSL
jgi:hypothetical protein